MQNLWQSLGKFASDKVKHVPSWLPLGCVNILTTAKVTRRESQSAKRFCGEGLKDPVVPSI